MVGEEGKTKVAVPPYLAYATFLNFVNTLRAKGGVPGRIDRSVLVQFSGAVQAQLLAALRYLGMIGSDGIPTEKLEQLVSLDGENRARLWREIMQQAYPYIFDGAFSLQSATSRQIEERFGEVASGDSVRKCVSFFLSAAKDAGFPMSPFIKPVKAKRNGGGKSRRQVAERSTPPVHPHPAPALQQAGEEVRNGSWKQMLLAKFPNFDPAWPDDVKTKWFEAFDKLMKQGQ